MPLSRRALLRWSCAFAAILPAAFVHAGNLDWTSRSGGSWADQLNAWDLPGGGAATWNNTNMSIANFGETPTPGIVTIDGHGSGGPITTNQIIFNASGWTLASGRGTLNLAGANPTISVPNGIQFDTISASIKGTDGLTFEGPGAIILSGASTYTGGTTLVSADVIVKVDNALPVDTVSVGVASTMDLQGTNQSFTQLLVDGSIEIGAAKDSSQNLVPGTGQLNVTSLSGSGNIDIFDGGILTATVNDSTNIFSGNINPSGGTDGTLIKEGIGTLVLSGNANLTGAFTSVAYDVDQGTLMGTTSTLGNSIFVNTNATLALKQSTSGAFDGVISGAGHVQIASSAGPITISFDDDNTYTGDTTLFSNASLAVSDDNQLGTLATGKIIVIINGKETARTTFAYANLVFEGGTLSTVNTIISQRNLQITALGGTIDTNLNSSTFYGTISELTAHINGIPVDGTGPLNVIGRGTATFSSPGLAPVTSSFDSLNVINAAVIFDYNAVTLSDAGTSLNVNGGSLTLQNGAALNTNGAAISGFGVSGNVIVDGASTTWTASGSVDIATSLGSGSLLLQNGAHATLKTLTLARGLASTASLTVTSGGSLDTQNASIGNEQGHASAAVTGAGSSWNVDENLTLADDTNPNIATTGSLSVSLLGAVSVGGTTTLASSATITVNHGTFTTGALVSTTNTTAITIADVTSPALVVGSDTAPDGVYSGTIGNFQGSPGSVLKVGTNTQTFSGNNTYTGATTSNGGNLILSGSTASSSFVANNGGTLTLSGVALNLGFESITANAGGTVVYNNSAAIAGGFLFGPGLHVFDGGTVTGSQIFNGAQVTVKTATFTGVNSAAAISVASSVPGLTWNGGNNDGSLTIAGFGEADVSAFTSSGVINVDILGNLNVNSADLILSGGSRTYVNATYLGGTIFAPGHINLNGNNAIQLNGGLLVNNGIITGPTYVNFGGVAKGTGTYGEVFVSDGGTFAPGNSPGNAMTGDATWEAAGGYEWQIADAGGAGGVGFDHWTVNGALSITAGQTANSRFVITIKSLDVTDDPADAANFDSTRAYSWEILSASDGIAGFDPNDFTLDSSAFKNDLGGGRFSLSETGDALDLNFTPASAVPEPASLALLAIPLLVLAKRRGRRSR